MHSFQQPRSRDQPFLDAWRSNQDKADGKLLLEEHNLCHSLRISGGCGVNAGMDFAKLKVEGQRKHVVVATSQAESRVYQ